MDIRKNMLLDYPDVMTVADMQSALQIGKNAAYDLIRQGKIPHMRIGNLIRVLKPSVIDFVMESCYTGNVATGNTALSEQEETT